MALQRDVDVIQLLPAMDGVKDLSLFVRDDCKLCSSSSLCFSLCFVCVSTSEVELFRVDDGSIMFSSMMLI